MNDTFVLCCSYQGDVIVLNAPTRDLQSIRLLQTIKLQKKGQDANENEDNEMIEDIYAIQELKNTESTKQNEKSVQIIIATAVGLYFAVFSVKMYGGRAT